MRAGKSFSGVVIGVVGVVGALCCGLATTAPAQAAEELTWQQLASRSDLWPTQCTLKEAVKFQDGASVRAGQTMDVLELTHREAFVGTPDGNLNFGIDPTKTDVLAQAQKIWAELTPAQRELTYPALLNQRKDLWPYRVALTKPLSLSTGETLAKGTEMILLGAEGSNVDLLDAKSNTSFLLPPTETDLIARAREALAQGNTGLGRIGEELSGKLIQANGAPASFKPGNSPKVYAVYFSAGWCGPCRQFSPKFVEFYNRVKPQHPEFETVFVSGDYSDQEMKDYVKEAKFPWLAVDYNRRTEIPVIAKHQGNGIPQLLVLDANGAVLADSYQNGRYIGPDAALQRLEAILAKQTS